jgi:hypothetical protein
MNKDEQLARLLRLKRYEKPDADYFDGFLDRFHAYQRKAIATQSAAFLIWERVCTACSALRRPSTAWAAVGAYAAVMLLIHVWPAPDHAAKTTLVISGSPPAPTTQTPTPETFRSWPTTLPAGETIPVSDSPGLKPPAPGKRRTADQPQDLQNVIGPASTKHSTAEPAKK